MMIMTLRNLIKLKFKQNYLIQIARLSSKAIKNDFIKINMKRSSRNRKASETEHTDPALPQKKSKAPLEVANSDQSSWTETGILYTGGLMIWNSNSTPSDKIVGFDMDSTLICTKTGKTFAVNENDWKLLYPSIPEVLKKYSADGYRIVIFTNQGGVAAGKQDKRALQRKIQELVTALDVPVMVLAAIDDNEFRKPCPGM